MAMSNFLTLCHIMCHGVTLVTLCEARFVERHDAILVFLKYYKFTFDALERIQKEH